VVPISDEPYRSGGLALPFVQIVSLNASWYQNLPVKNPHPSAGVRQRNGTQLMGKELTFWAKTSFAQKLLVFVYFLSKAPVSVLALF
jgi:hypothetical protein